MTHPLQPHLRAALTSPTDSAHDAAHADRVYSNARTIAASEGPVDETVLICACYLHDLVTLPKDAPNRAEASRLSAAAAGPILQQLDLSDDKITATQHAIIAHSYSAQVAPETLEAMIVQDADRVESLGAIGLARVFAVSGALGRPLFDGDDPFATQRPFEDGQ
ncbi:MAG: HD domain-containing protein [Pseudomonadota bacterium]